MKTESGARVAIGILALVAILIATVALLTVKVAPARQCNRGHPCATATSSPTLSPTPTPTTSPTPSPTATQSPSPTPTASPSPTPSPIASPTLTPSPTATPGACSRVATAPTNGTDATAGLLADINATPNGGTLCLTGPYRTSGQIHVPGRNGLTIEGNGASITRQTDASSPLFEFDHWGNDLTVRDLVINGGGTQSGTDRVANEAGHAIAFGGVLRASVSNVTSNNTTGEFVYISGGYDNATGAFRASDSITVTDSTVNGTGRMGIAITDGGNHVTVQRVAFHNVAGYGFDIEPNGHPELGNPGAHDVLFADNTYFAPTQGTHIGIPKMISVSVQAPVYNLQILRNHSVGFALRFALGGNYNGAAFRLHDVVVDSNVGDATSADYPIELHDCDNVQVTNNRQPLKVGQPFPFQAGCTAVTISGNS